MKHYPRIIVIGAGFTGCAIAHDLALRGFPVIVLERGDIASGTSGRTHGLLHSGSRYCVTDGEAAVECIQENIILRRIAAQCIEFNEGFFVALDEEDLNYAPQFVEGCRAAGIPVHPLTPQQALSVEPNLNPNLLAAYRVPDGAFDPLRLALSFAATAKRNGAVFLTYHEVKGLILRAGGVAGVIALNRHRGQEVRLEADLVVNATGAWAGIIAAMANIHVPVVPTPGVMVAYNRRLINRVVNRLNTPGDGDILIPQRRMVVIGTTSFETPDIDYIPVDENQVEEMWRKAVELVPAVANAEQRGAYMSARPLIGSGEAGRSLSRTFKSYAHRQNDGVSGFITITGGKATTCRLMAEKAADMVCEQLGISAVCRTAELPLDSYRTYYQSMDGDAIE